MGIRFFCPNGHKLNVKAFQAGKRGICPFCASSVQIPAQSTRPSSRQQREASIQIQTTPSETESSEAKVSQQSGPSVEQAPPLPSTESPGTDRSAAPLEAGGGSNTAQTFPVSEKPAPVSEKPAPVSSTASESIEPTSAPEPVASSPVPSPPLPPAPPDPLTEAPNAVWYVQTDSGSQFGPAPAETMRVWIAEGRVTQGALVWREGWQDWQEASTVFPQLASDSSLHALKTIATDAEPAHAGSTGRHHPSAQRGHKSNNMTLILVLVVIVIVLVIVFAIVLSRSLGSTSAVPGTMESRPVARAGAGAKNLPPSCGTATSVQEPVPPAKCRHPLCLEAGLYFHLSESGSESGNENTRIS